MALTDSLVSFWELEEASGSRADSAGTNTLTDNNSVASAAGIVGTGADFEHDVASQSLSHPDNSQLSPGNNSFCFQAWVKLESKVGTADEIILGKDDGTDGEYFLFWDHSLDLFRWQVYGGAGHTPFADAQNTTPTVGNWYHLIAWYDKVGQEVGLVVNDNSPATQSPYTSGAFDTTATFRIGNGQFGGGGFDGVIDQVGFWSRVLTSSERTQLYNGGNGLSYAAMVGAIPAKIIFRNRDYV